MGRRWKKRRWMTWFFQVKFCFQHTGGKQPKTVENQSSPNHLSQTENTTSLKTRERPWLYLHSWPKTQAVRDHNVRDKNSRLLKRFRPKKAKIVFMKSERVTCRVSTKAHERWWICCSIMYLYIAAVCMGRGVPPQRDTLKNTIQTVSLYTNYYLSVS